jgi:phosphoribosylanthranilate isomerase
VSLESVRELANTVSPGIERVGVFVEENYAVISDAVREARLDLAQVHRQLRDEDLRRIRVPIVAVAKVGETIEELPDAKLLTKCRAILFDTASGHSQGGTGRRFAWDLIAGRDFGVPVFLAGGLDPANVADAIRAVRPSAVDVSTGVEERPGAKDPRKLANFFEAVRRSDALAS